MSDNERQSDKVGCSGAVWGQKLEWNKVGRQHGAGWGRVRPMGLHGAWTLPKGEMFNVFFVGVVELQALTTQPSNVRTA